MKRKEIIPIAIILLAGVILALFILRTDRASLGSASEDELHEGGGKAHGAPESKKGKAAQKIIEISPEKAAGAGVEIKIAGPVQMKTILKLPGEIILNQNKVAHVVPRLSGVVSEVRKNLGDRVKKGETLLVLDSRELAAVKTEYIESVHRLEFAQANFVREEELWKKKISPEQDYLASRHALEEAEIARQAGEQKLMTLGLTPPDLRLLAVEPEGRVVEREVRAPFIPKALTRYELKSPLNGTVIEKRISVGETIKEDADIYIVADLTSVWGEMKIPVKELRSIRMGQPVTVRSEDLGLEATGKISFIGSLVGAESRAASAHVDIPNPKGLWRPGLFVTIEVVQGEAAVPVAIPAEAVQTLDGKPVVFVQEADHFQARPVVLGRSDGKWVEIEKGLSSGDKVAGKNSFVLKAELEKGGVAHDH
jgi:cobalt-zinc-cadmium efflux system membrane fusion protein